MKKRVKIIIIIGIILFIISPPFQYFKSILVLSANNFYHSNNSLLKEENIEVKMVGGWATEQKDWFPFVNCFNPSEGFSRFFGKDVEVFILYNFAHFNLMKGSSLYYDENSDYFNSFYGAYIVKGKDMKFGYFKDDTPNYDEMALVPEYDMKALVLGGFGCDNPQFDFKVNHDYTTELLGYNNWNVMEATVMTNSPMHKSTHYRQAYLQYGKPLKNTTLEKDFPIVEMKGKFYGRYFEEKQCSIFFYIIASDMNIIKEWEVDILNKTTLNIDKKG